MGRRAWEAVSKPNSHVARAEEGMNGTYALSSVEEMLLIFLPVLTVEMCED